MLGRLRDGEQWPDRTGGNVEITGHNKVHSFVWSGYKNLLFYNSYLPRLVAALSPGAGHRRLRFELSARIIDGQPRGIVLREQVPAHVVRHRHGCVPDDLLM